MGINNWKYVHPENLKPMKTIEIKPKEQFDAVRFMREQRNKLSEKLGKMSKAEVVEYFRKRKTETTVRPSA